MPRFKRAGHPPLLPLLRSARTANATTCSFYRNAALTSLGNTFVTFSKGAGQFSVRVHEDGEPDDGAHSPDAPDERRSPVRRTTLAECLAREG